MANLSNAGNPMLLPNLNLSTDSGNQLNAQSPAQALLANPRVAAVNAVTLVTNPTNGDVLTLTVANKVLPGGSLAVSVTASSDTAITAAGKLAAALTSNLVAMAYNLFATSAGTAEFTVNELGPVGNSSSLTFASTGSTTAVLSNQTSSTAVVGGTETDADVVTIRFSNATFSGGHEDVSVTTSGSEGLAAIATAMNTAINTDAVLQAAHISSTVASETLTISQKGPNFATLSYTAGGNTETVVFKSLAGLLQGGSGPIVPLSNFTVGFGSAFQNLVAGQPYSFSDQTVAALVANSNPIK